MTTLVASVSAQVANVAATCRMLEGLRHAQRIRKNLSRPLFVRQWHQATERSFWITSDGSTALCLTVSGLTADQTATIGKSFDERRVYTELPLSACTMRDIIEAELDVAVSLVN
jgi:hypothetical protein